MSPLTSGTLWRYLLLEEEGKEPFIVDDHVIPNSTKVGVNTYSIYHSEVSVSPFYYFVLAMEALAPLEQCLHPGLFTGEYG